jgi:hypothetical protein
MFSTLMIDSRNKGREIWARRVHLAKASSPIVFVESGSVMDVSEEHSRKASFPIVVSVSGSVMDVSEEHPEKA